MDDSLQFKLPAEKTPVEQDAEEKNAEEKAPAEQVSEEKAPAEKASAAEETETIAPDVKKDFRGVMCPMNFVKTKIALTPMQSGQILEILLDDGAPIENVPGSVKNEGHTILSTEKVENYWKVLIKKK